jgi:hypothetical protein
MAHAPHRAVNGRTYRYNRIGVTGPKCTDYGTNQHCPVEHPTGFRNEVPVRELKELCIVIDFNLDRDGFDCLAVVTK